MNGRHPRADLLRTTAELRREQEQLLEKALAAAVDERYGLDGATVDISRTMAQVRTIDAELARRGFDPLAESDDWAERMVADDGWWKRHERTASMRAQRARGGKTTMSTQTERRAKLIELELADPKLRERAKARREADNWRVERLARARDVDRADVTELGAYPNRARDLALRRLDDKRVVDGLSTRSVDALERAIRDVPEVADRMIVLESAAYRSAFQKYVRGAQSWAFTEDEQNALVRYAETYRKREVERAQSEGTAAAGGYAVPPTLDATIILTDSPTPNPYWTLCTVHDIDTGTWKGLTSVAPSWSVDGEATEVSDDSMTSIGQPVIPTYTHRGFIGYSQEVGEDWVDFQAQMTTALAAGFNEITLDKFTSGTGSNEPRGILTALAAASPTVLVTSTTDGTFSSFDIMATWDALPERWKPNAVWMASSSVASQVRLNDSGLYHASAVPLDARVASVDVLNGRQLVENARFPVWTSTTGAATRLVVGDWSQFHIARRRGMFVENVGLLPDPSNNRPNGTRGLLATARVGSDCPNPNAFRIQVNT